MQSQALLSATPVGGGGKEGRGGERRSGGGGGGEEGASNYRWYPTIAFFLSCFKGTRGASFLVRKHGMD